MENRHLKLRAVNYYVNDFVFIYLAICCSPIIYIYFPTSFIFISQGKTDMRSSALATTQLKKTFYCTFFVIFIFMYCMWQDILHTGCVLKSLAIDRILVTVCLLPPGLFFL